MEPFSEELFGFQKPLPRGHGVQNPPARVRLTPLSSQLDRSSPAGVVLARDHVDAGQGLELDTAEAAKVLDPEMLPQGSPRFIQVEDEDLLLCFEP